ncbi:hypothetical protein CONPUDRAFT_149414 [Coniophora puteana RWD-64-598 SS2]|uniref:Uncharacterized protein n=1 Tax=Coniophora puteana (strain RWD-64-598) TaxID=741705 RepID=A0A5M3N958_CONPW|nr:uncharacterized protein CONPUDRAFT_149414 [Coniophora puteana RWD-64-598 SS2]EIW87381.1 hypothetical protein CONPUDRAFT_149414 [Coniophora puteana RWD-64-598 SS2]
MSKAPSQSPTVAVGALPDWAVAAGLSWPSTTLHAQLFLDALTIRLNAIIEASARWGIEGVYVATLKAEIDAAMPALSYIGMLRSSYGEDGFFVSIPPILRWLKRAGGPAGLVSLAVAKGSRLHKEQAGWVPRYPDGLPTPPYGPYSWWNPDVGESDRDDSVVESEVLQSTPPRVARHGQVGAVHSTRLAAGATAKHAAVSNVDGGSSTRKRRATADVRTPTSKKKRRFQALPVHQAQVRKPARGGRLSAADRTALKQLRHPTCPDARARADEYHDGDEYMPNGAHCTKCIANGEQECFKKPGLACWPCKWKRKLCSLEKEKPATRVRTERASSSAKSARGNTATPSTVHKRKYGDIDNNAAPLPSIDHSVVNNADVVDDADADAEMRGVVVEESDGDDTTGLDVIGDAHNDSARSTNAVAYQGVGRHVTLARQLTSAATLLSSGLPSVGTALSRRRACNCWPVNTALRCYGAFTNLGSRSHHGEIPFFHCNTILTSVS